VWLERQGTRESTLDLFGRGFVLLVARGGAAWREAARRAAGSSRIPLEALTIGEGGDLGDPDGRWASVYGVEDDGAALVRPDGHVAWRCASGRSGSGVPLDAALASILGWESGGPRTPLGPAAGSGRPASLPGTSPTART
jgi:hypothetical protein